MYSIPVPDFISDDTKRNKALEMLKQKVESLEDNASCISIACNTAHVLLPQLQKVSTVPFVSMIDETAKQIYRDGKVKVGIMGTPSTIRYKLYQNALTKYGISVVEPSEKQINSLEKIIRNILRGKKLISDQRKLLSIADSLRKKEALAIILGCTELPLMFPKKYLLPVYNSLEILAISLLQKYYKQ